MCFSEVIVFKLYLHTEYRTGFNCRNKVKISLFYPIDVAIQGLLTSGISNICYSNHSVLYGVTNSNFRSGYKKLLKKMGLDVGGCVRRLGYR